MLILHNPVKDYAWGTVDGLSRLLGSSATGRPEAEMWIGAYPSAPSRLDDGRPLDQAVAADPDALLGPTVRTRFGDRLPFLLKVLAIASPLSIQLHPTTPQAEEGFDREDSDGVALDDPRRTYKDRFAKPEVLVALEPTWVLAGLRSGAEAASALRRPGDPALEPLAALVVDAPDARDALVHLLGADDDERAVLAAAAVALAHDDGDPAVGWVTRLAASHPDDPTALAPLLLGLSLLAPGDGVFLPAGVPHAYLEGAGVELQGASDNVVRGGLTAKHVDRHDLVRLMAAPGTDAQPMGRSPDAAEASGPRRYLPPVPEIALRRIQAQAGGAPAPVDGPGPALVLGTGPTTTVAVDGEVIELGGGRAVLVAPAERDRCRVAGTGLVWWATVADASAQG